MSGFTYTLAPLVGMPGRYGEREATARHKLEKELSYLGPWCSNCGKRGKNCRDRVKCNVRKITRSKAPSHVALPMPPMEWCEAKGYATTSYHSRWTLEDWRDLGRPQEGRPGIRLRGGVQMIRASWNS